MHRRSLNLATTDLIELLSTPGFFVKRYILYTNEVFCFSIWSKYVVKNVKLSQKFVIKNFDIEIAKRLFRLQNVGQDSKSLCYSDSR